MLIVSPASNTHECGSVTMSANTMGSSVYLRTPFRAFLLAASNAALISSTLAAFFKLTVKSVRDPVGVGTRRAVPSSLPFIDSITSDVARAAPVEVGTILIAAPRARRRSLCGPSTRFWSPV